MREAHLRAITAQQYLSASVPASVRVWQMLSVVSLFAIIYLLMQ